MNQVLISRHMSKTFLSIYICVVHSISFRNIFIVIFHFWKLNLKINAIVYSNSFPISSKKTCGGVRPRGKVVVNNIVAGTHNTLGGRKHKTAVVLDRKNSAVSEANHFTRHISGFHIEINLSTVEYNEFSIQTLRIYSILNSFSVRSIFSRSWSSFSIWISSIFFKLSEKKADR